MKKIKPENTVELKMLKIYYTNRPKNSHRQLSKSYVKI